MVDRFVVGCYGLVFDSGNLLMVRQGSGHWAGKWIVPGGKLETGETFEQCVEREVLEETSCKVRAVKQVKVVTSYSPGSKFEKQVVLVFYLCKLLGGEPEKGDGVSAALWIDEEQFKRMAMNETIPEQIFDAVSAACGDTSAFPAVSLDFARLICEDGAD